MMKYLVTILCLLLPALSQAQVVPDVKAKKIAGHTYVIHGPRELPSPQNKGFMNNPGFVVTKTGVVVIDPGSSLYVGQMVLRQIRKVTNKPVTHVLSTHIHGDHWLGNQAFAEAFPKAKLMAHPQMVAEAKAGAAEQWIRLMDNLTGGASKGTKAVIPANTVDDGDSFETGGITFRMLAPKHAHSGTDVMIHVVEDAVVFTGDNSLYQRIGRMDDATFRGNMNACNIALKLRAKVYVPGHGDSGGPSRVSEFRDYMKLVYENVAKYYEQGMSDYEMKPRVVAALKHYHNWSGFEHEIGKHINLAMLEYEKAQFE